MPMISAATGATPRKDTPAIPHAGPVRGRSKWILMGSLGFNIFTLYALYGAVIKVFLPNQIAGIDPHNKINNLALLYAIMSICTTIATPLAGALSDRTRTRFGRRAPFIVFGALVAMPLMFALAFMTRFWTITLFWIVAAFSYNLTQVPMTTLIADRFDDADRGKASGLLSIGQNTGLSVGVVAAGLLASHISLGYVAFAAAVLCSCIAFIAINREPPSLQAAVTPFRWPAFLKSFWVDPRRHPDFGWAFLSRFCMYMGFTLITTYLLYILEDYVGLSKAAANTEIAKIFSIQLVGLVSMSLIAGVLSDWLGACKPFVILASLLIALAYAVPLMSATVTGMNLYAAIVGVGYGAFTSVDMALMTKVLPRGNGTAGKDLGLLTIALNIPLVLGPVVAATILDLSGHSYVALFSCAVLLITASALFVLPIRSVR